MAGFPQSSADLNRHLRDQIEFLKLSASNFDAGFHSEAKRLATTIRVLVYDHKMSKSLLGLLGVKNSLPFMNSAVPRDPRNLMPHHPLVGLKVTPNGASFFPMLEDQGPHPVRYRTTTFNDWWNELVIIDPLGGQFSRRELVLSLANKDGGAHVDPILSASYAALTRQNSVGWAFRDANGNEAPIAGIELHSVRQIAHELQATLDRSGLAEAVGTVKAGQAPGNTTGS